MHVVESRLDVRCDAHGDSHSERQSQSVELTQWCCELCCWLVLGGRRRLERCVESKYRRYCTGSQGVWVEQTKPKKVLRCVTSTTTTTARTALGWKYQNHHKLLPTTTMRNYYAVSVYIFCLSFVSHKGLASPPRMSCASKREPKRSSHANSCVRQTFRANFTTFLEFTLKWLSIKFTSWFGASLCGNGLHYVYIENVPDGRVCRPRNALTSSM